MLRSRIVFRRWRLRVLRWLGRRQLLHVCEEPVRAYDVRRELLVEADMLKTWAMLGARSVLLPGRVVGRSLLDVREGPVRSGVVLGALLVEADMLRARAMHG